MATEYTIQFGELLEGVQRDLWQEKITAESVEKAEEAMAMKRGALINGGGYTGGGTLTAALV